MQCWKCGGSGYLPQYSHVEDGTCFACDGDGTLTQTDRVILAKDYAKKGSRPSGSLSNLLKTEHEFLDKDEMLKYRKALMRHAKKNGLTPKPGFHTAKLKKELQEITGRDERGMKPYEIPEGKEKPPTMERVTKSDGVKENPGGGELWKKGDKFYNEHGQLIVAPFNSTTESHLNAINNGKVMGSPYLDIARQRMNEYADIMQMMGIHSKNLPENFRQVMGTILDTVEERFSGVIANVALRDFNFTEIGANTNALGHYKLARPSGDIYTDFSLSISPHRLVDAIENHLKYETAESQYRLNKVATQVTTTIGHELGHAYHHQVMAKRKPNAYLGTTDYDDTPLANDLAEFYWDKIAALEEDGFDPTTVQNLYLSTKPNAEEVKRYVRGIQKEFPLIYGASDSTELFATVTELFIGGDKLRERVKADYPDIYTSFKKYYEGVLEL